MRELCELVLASISPRRYELLTSLGLRVVVIPSRIVEGDRPGLSPSSLASFHATAKAEAVVPQARGRVVLAADTVVDLDGTPLGKPRDRSEAAEILRHLSGREHLVHSAFCLIDGASGRRAGAISSTRVRFYALAEGEIAEYAASGDGLDKAGAYGIQGRGAVLVERIDGDFYTVMGLPLGAVVRSLRSFGYALPAALGATA